MERAAASASTSASDVRLLVFDFDLTILSIHSWGERIRPEDVASRSLDRDVADLAFFRRFIARALNTGVKVAIASPGVYEVIQAYMDLAVGPGVFTRENISTPSQHGMRDGHVVPEEKVPQLEVRARVSVRAESQPDESDVERHAARARAFSSLFADARASPILPPVPSSPQSADGQTAQLRLPAWTSQRQRERRLLRRQRENVAGRYAAVSCVPCSSMKRCFTRGRGRTRREGGDGAIHSVAVGDELLGKKANETERLL